MFGNNGKNNGNAVHVNGAAVASSNGNGHKPGACHTPQSTTLALGRALARSHPGARPAHRPRRWSPSARGAAAGPSTTSRGMPSSTRPTASSDSAAGDTSWSAT